MAAREKSMKRFSAWANRNALLAVWLGALAAFALMYISAPLIVRHVEQPTHRSAT